MGYNSLPGFLRLCSCLIKWWWARSRLYTATRQAGWYFYSSATASPALSFARSIPSFRVLAHSLRLSFNCIVIACRKVDVSDSSSHTKHTDDGFGGSGVLCLLLRLSSLHVEVVAVALFCVLCSFVLLNNNLQLWWYFALFRISVSSIPPPSSSLAGLSGIGIQLMAWNNGTLFAMLL